MAKQKSAASGAASFVSRCQRGARRPSRMQYDGFPQTAGFLAWTLLGLSLASQSCSLGIAQGRDLGAKAFLDSRLVHYKSVGGCPIWDSNRHSGSPGIPVCSPGDTADNLFFRLFKTKTIDAFFTLEMKGALLLLICSASSSRSFKLH